LCEVYEFGDVEIISKNKNLFQIAVGTFLQGKVFFYDKKLLA